MSCCDTLARLVPHGRGIAERLPGRAMPCLFFAAFLSVFAAIAAPAWAQTSEESDTAARLRQQLERWTLNLADVIGHDRFHYALDVTEDGDGTIVAAIRHLSIDIPGRLGRRQDIRWDVGDVVATFAPIDRGRYHVSWDLPARTAVLDRKGDRIGGTVIGSQSVSGVYAPGVGFSPQLEGVWSDVTAWLDIQDRGPLRLHVANISLDSTHHELSTGKWNGQDLLGLQGISMTFDGQEAVRLGGLGFEVSSGALDLAFLDRMNEVFERERLQRAAGHDDEDALMTQTSNSLVVLAREHAPLAESFEFTMTMDGLSARDPDDSSRSLSLAGAHLALGMTGLDGNRGSLVLEYEVDALDAAPVPELAAHFVPHDLVIDLTFDGLPVMDAATMVLNMMESAVLDPEAFEDAPEAVFNFVALSLQRRMVQQASSFQIRELAYDSSVLNATATGEIVAFAASPVMAVGSVRLEIAGLERLMRRLEAAAEAGDEEALEAAQSLALMQAMSVRSEDAGGARHLYDLALADDGRILLNGNDVGVLMGALAEP